MALNKLKSQNAQKVQYLRVLKNAFMIAFCLLLTACAHHSPAPVVDLYQTEVKLQQRIADAKKRLSIKKQQQIYHAAEQTNTFEAPSKIANTSQFVIQQPPKLVVQNNKKTEKIDKKPLLYSVKAGDTLYSIARKHGLKHQFLAKINHIKHNRIYLGQKLKLVDEQQNLYFDSNEVRLALNKNVLKKPVKTAKRVKKAVNNTPIVSVQTASIDTRSTQVSQSNNKKSKKIASQKLANRHANANSPRLPPSKSVVDIPSSRLNWIWPTEGRILSSFSGKENRGLDIAGKRGQAVRATAPGKVVYRGSGLKGYGNLVIIKHNNDYLSAYAHNEKVLVAENEFVKAGQRIADIGHSGAQQDKLHFQIRYKGKPVDPLDYLPKK